MRNVSKNRILFALSCAFTLAYLSYRIFCTIPLGADFVFFPILLILMEIMGYFELMQFFSGITDAKKTKKPEVTEDFFPDIDVFILAFEEPAELIRKSINACKYMDYPNKEKVHIYLCDDGKRAELRELSRKYNIEYIRRDSNRNGKAGNLNNVLNKTNSPIMAIFEANMIPRRNFLMETVPYFDLPKVGFVQAPKQFYNPDLFQYNLYSEDKVPDEQDHFYKSLQLSKNKTNSVIFCGTNVVVAREALEDIGGFPKNSVSPDFMAGVEIQSERYNSYSIDETVATGLNPMSLDKLINQRIRWTVSGIESGRKSNFLFRKRLNFSQRLSYLSWFLSWYAPVKRMMFLFAPIISIIFGVKLIQSDPRMFLLFWVPMYILNSYTYREMSHGIRDMSWSGVYETILGPFLFIPVLLETIGLGKKIPLNRNENSKSFYLIPHTILTILTIISLGVLISNMLTNFSGIQILFLAWLLINMYSLLMSMFFISGRRINRKAARYKTSVAGLLTWDYNKLDLTTYDISETGFSAILDFPHYIPHDAEITTSILGNGLVSRFKSSVVNVGKIGDKYKFSFKIDDIAFEEQNKLFSIVYDREPSLPSVIDLGYSIVDYFMGWAKNIFGNIKGRIPKPNWFNRKLARVVLNQYMKTKEGALVFVHDFNYEYVSMDMGQDEIPPETASLPVTDEMYMKLSLIKSDDGGKNKGRYLYKVTNLDELVDDAMFKSILSRWIGIYNNNLQEKLIHISENHI